ncbi:vanomycin resistance protein VanB [Asanoa ishikariensis]|uniref:Vancomycin resistance protein YoaR, contains peptidoglycan-binding and VanW domains n=1 Tax=Asanoa ishikariensis TaxID=137265 RepID=A0A1H3UXX2_9ACTN|nr:VanW family protein [Asanoa ishikariensis]GIF69981.1 vanomycin resistance protein VanB [Asanoa ishikariensis]SDZ67136.1 Vancomycin resistance protein YoaR, contains peptidoglycan-binding and VanW domains [Asanoa ishikariensis]
MSQHPQASDAPTVQFPVQRLGEPSAPQATPVEALRPRRRLFMVGGLAAAVLGAIGGAGAYAYAGEVPRGTSVLGVDIGGKSRSEAVAALKSGLAWKVRTLGAPVPVRVGEQAAEVNPADVGLAVDVEATVAAAIERSADPVSLLFGSHELDPVVTVDEGKLHDVLGAALGKDARAMKLPSITFAGTTPKATYPVPGRGLHAEKSADAVRDGWLGGAPVVVPIVEIHPTTTKEDVDKLIAEFARPAVAAPVTVTTERGDVTVAPAAIAKSLRLVADKSGRIEPGLDAKKLRAALAGPLGAVEVAPKDAQVSIVGGKPRVTEGAEGRQVDVGALAPALLEVLPLRDGRTVAGKLVTAKPATSAADIAKLGIKERVSTFTTNFTGGLSAPRSQNIVQAAKEVDGALVKPGAVFSLNGRTGERGYAQGYRDAPVILDGKLVPGVGGGTSQFTTTLFNAAYYAGLEDIEHKPHSYYFSRYPAVIESTIFWPNLDLKFRNDTDYGIVIDTSWTADSITVSMYSTKVWDSVKTQYGPRRDITSPKVTKLPKGPTCIPTNGIPGFTQDAFRVFRKAGKEVKREKFTWTYLAEPRFTCG